MERSLPRRSTADLNGTLFLRTTVVGSGIMREKLAGGNVARPARRSLQPAQP